MRRVLLLALSFGGAKATTRNDNEKSRKITKQDTTAGRCGSWAAKDLHITNFIIHYNSPPAVLDRHKPYMTDYWPLLDILPQIEISLMSPRLPSRWEGSLFCGVQTKLGDITASKLMKTSCPHQRTWRQLVIMSCNIHTVDIALLNFQSLGNLDKKSEFIYCHFYDVS